MKFITCLSWFFFLATISYVAWTIVLVIRSMMVCNYIDAILYTVLGIAMSIAVVGVGGLTFTIHKSMLLERRNKE